MRRSLLRGSADRQRRTQNCSDSGQRELAKCSAAYSSADGLSHGGCPPTIYYARTKDGISLPCGNVPISADPLLTHCIRSASPHFGCVAFENGCNALPC